MVENHKTEQTYSFLKFSWRITALHTIMYSIAGAIALVPMSYKEQFSGSFLSNFMKPINSSMVALGPILQIFNGFMMSIFLFPIRKLLIDNIKNSWKILFLLVAGFSFFTPQVPGIGNFEGIIYTQAPLYVHFFGIPECLIYSILFSFGFLFWYKNDKKWMNTISIILVCLVGTMNLYLIR